MALAASHLAAADVLAVVVLQQDFSVRIPEVCESVSRSRESIITAKRHMRKGEKKRFTNDDDKRREKKKKVRFPARATRLGPGQGIFCSIQPTVILTAHQ